MRKDSELCLLCGEPTAFGEPNPHFLCTLGEDFPLDLDFASANCKAVALSGQMHEARI